MKESEK